MSFKLFLGGVAPTTQKEDIVEHFAKYGTVTDAVVMYKDGRHRGFGFVTFAEEEAMNAVLMEQQIIHDRTIDVKQAVPGDQQGPRGGAMNGGMGGAFGGAFGGGMGGGIGGAFGGGGAAPSGAPRSGGKGGPKGGHQGPTDKVFLGGLAPTTTDEILSEYFGRYGTLVDVVVMKDKLSQKSRGFGFVRYDSTEPVEQVMAEYESHEIDGKWIEVKKAVPQEQMGVTRGGIPVKGAPIGKGGYGGFGGGMGGKGGYGGGKGYCGGGYCGGGGGGYGACGGYGAMAPYGAARQAPYGGGYGGGYMGKGGGYGAYQQGGGAYVAGGCKGGFRHSPY